MKFETLREDRPPIRKVQDFPDFGTRRELSELTGLAVQTLARWAVEHKGPKITKLGGYVVRYAREDVAAWLREQQEATA